jgi:hypothetical protein
VCLPREKKEWAGGWWKPARKGSLGRQSATDKRPDKAPLLLCSVRTRTEYGLQQVDANFEWTSRAPLLTVCPESFQTCVPCIHTVTVSGAWVPTESDCTRNGIGAEVEKLIVVVIVTVSTAT